MYMHQLAKYVLASIAAVAAGSGLAADNLAQPNIPTTTTQARVPASRLDPPALARAQQKLDRVKQLVEGFAPSARAQGLPESWRVELLTNLMQGAEPDFAKLALAPDARSALGVSRAIANAGTATAKALGDSTNDLVFQPIPPCRDVDTRNSGAGGALAAQETRAFVVNNSSTQGQECNPATYFLRSGYPAAIAVNITVINIGYPGVIGAFLRAYPDGANPSGSWLNYNPNSITANAGILTVNAGNQGMFDIFAYTKADVVVDVFGFFVPPIAQTVTQAPVALECTYPTSGAVAIANNGDAFAFSANCQNGYVITGGSCTASDNRVLISSASTFGVAYFCGYHNYSGASQNVTATANCCRVPSQNILLP